MKKFLITLIMAAIMLTQTVWAKPNQSFHYNYGDSAWTRGDFWIWTENDKTFFEGSATGNNVFVDVFAETDAKIWSALNKVIRDHKIHLWNGFKKENFDIMDGSGFSLDMQYGTRNIRARGYMAEPQNYQAGHAALVKFLTERAKELPVTVPSADEVGYMFAYAGGLRFDLMLAQYDGVYARVDFLRVSQATDEDNYITFYPFREFTAGERERYAEMDFETARQIREKLLTLPLSNGFPSTDESSSYAVISYEGHKSTATHYCRAVLSEEDQRWLLTKMAAVAGLPEDFDFNSLY